MFDKLVNSVTELFKSGEAAHAAHQKLVDLIAKDPANIARVQADENYAADRNAIEDYWWRSRYPNSILIEEFVQRFGEDKTNRFLNVFALRRGACPQFRYFASDAPPNPAERAPLFLLEGGRVSCPLHAMLYNAMYDHFGETLESSDVRDRYFRQRGGYLERRSNELISSLFPDATLQLRQFYETADSQNEHDGLILYQHALISIEAKSADMPTPFRDPGRAYTRLSRQFNSSTGIQHAYDQSLRVINLIRTATCPVEFFDKGGAKIADITPKDIQDAFSICVTLESFGYLATDLTMLLTVPAGAAYPYVVNLYDLEAIVDAFHRKGLKSLEFLEFLRGRRDNQGRVVSGDELNIVGSFIQEHRFPSAEPGEVRIVEGYADLFDDLYYENHGIKRDSMRDAVPGGVEMDLRESLKSGEPVFARTEPMRRAVKRVGRNERCPCGSGKKYKRCCGAT